MQLLIIRLLALITTHKKPQFFAWCISLYLLISFNTNAINVINSNKYVIELNKVGNQQGLFDRNYFFNFLEDSEHYIWVINTKNLYRYNGTNIESLTHLLKKFQPGEIFYSMNKIDDNHIFILTSNNFYVINLLTLKVIEANGFNKMLHNGTIIKIFFDNNKNQFTVLTDNYEVIVFNITRENNSRMVKIIVTNRMTIPKLEINKIYGMYGNGDFVFFNSNFEKRKIYNLKSKKEIIVDPEIKQLINEHFSIVKKLTNDNNITLYKEISGEKKLVKLKVLEEKIELISVNSHFDTKDFKKQSIPLKENNTLIITLDGKFIITDSANKTVVDITDKINDYFGNFSLATYCFTTSDNTVWIWIEDGFALLNVHNAPSFKKILYNENLSESGVGVSVRAIEEDSEGKIYISTYGTENDKGNTFGIFDKEKEYLQSISFSSEKCLLYTYRIKSIDNEHLLNLGLDRTFELYNTKTKKFRCAYKNPSEVTPYNFDFDYNNTTHKIYVGSQAGLYLNQNFFDSNYNFNLIPETLPLEIKHINSLGNDKFILATQLGIYFLENEKIVSIISDDDKASIRIPPAKFHHTILKDSILWASSNIGLFEINLRQKIHKLYDTKNGLSNSYIYAAIPFRNYLWLSSNGGLSTINLQDKIIKNYTLQDGLPTHEFNTGAYLMTRDSTIFFGSINGLVYFKPKDFIDEQNVKINYRLDKINYFLDGEQKSIDSFPKGEKTITFPVNTSLINILYFIPKFTNPSQAELRYRFTNIADSNWIYTNSQTILLTKLNPGKHHIQVQFSMEKGGWSDNFDSINIVIKNHWYYSIYFFISVFLGLLGIFYAILQYRMHQVRKFNNFRHNLSKDMHDEIGSTLSSISLYSQSLSMTPLTDKQKHIVSKIKKYALTTQESISDIIWSLKSENLEIEKVILKMQDFGLSIAETKNINFSFKVDENLYNTKLSQIELRNMYLIFKEAINNAVKHSNCTEISTIITTDNIYKFKITIADNGIGFEYENVFKGNGLVNIKSRCKEINANFTYSKNLPNGTILKIKKPK